MFATMKIVGVTPDAIGRLHEIVGSLLCRTTEQITISTNGGVSAGNQEYVHIEESKFDGAHGTYTVTLKFNLVFTDRPDDYLTYQPAPVLLSVLRSIDPNLLGDKEQKIPTEKKARELRHEQI